MVLETLVFSPFNHLTWLAAREDFIKFNVSYVSIYSFVGDSYKEIVSVTKLISYKEKYFLYLSLNMKRPKKPRLTPYAAFRLLNWPAPVNIMRKSRVNYASPYSSNGPVGPIL
jgi:hypothetical protein